MRTLSACLLSALATCLAAPAFAAAPHAAAPTRDAVGDPLPKDAIARLGTARFRTIGPSLQGIAISPDAKLIALSFSVGRPRISLIDVATGREVRSIPTNAFTGSLAFSPDGKEVISATYNGNVLFYDVAQGKEVRQVKVQSNRPEILTYSPDGSVFAAAERVFGRKTPVGVYEVKSGKQRFTVDPLHTGQIGLILSHDTKYLASYGSASSTGKEDRDEVAKIGRTVQVYDLETGKAFKHLELAQSHVVAAAFSPDKKTLAVSSLGELQLWDFVQGKRLKTSRAPSRSGTTGGLQFSPDGKLLVMGGRGSEGTPAVWELASGRRLMAARAPDCILQGIGFRDGSVIAVGLRSQALVVWDVLSGKRHGSDAGHATQIAGVVAPRSGRVYTVGTDGRVIGWDGWGRQVEVVSEPTNSTRFGLRFSPASTAVFSPNGNAVVMAEVYGTLSVRSVESGEDLFIVPRAGIDNCLPAFSGDGKVLAMTTPSGPTTDLTKQKASIRVIRADSGEEVAEITPPDKALPVGLALDPSGKRLAMALGSQDFNVPLSIVVWRLDTNKPDETFTKYEHPAIRGFRGVTPLAFSPDGQTLAITLSQGGGGVQVFDAATGKALSAINAGGYVPLPPVFSPDGRSLAIAAASDTNTGTWKAAVWELRSGKKRWEATLPTQPTALAYGPNGLTLLSGHADTTALIWDVTGRSRQGKALNAGGWDAVVRDLQSDDAVKAFEAQRTLVASGAVAVLRQRVKPAAGKSITEKELAALVKELDDDDFEVRGKAFRLLEEQGKAAEAALKKGLVGDPSAEVKRSVRALLAKITQNGGSEEALQALQASRAAEVLGWIGTAEARALLADLAGGRSGAPLTVEAKAALERLK